MAEIEIDRATGALLFQGYVLAEIAEGVPPSIVAEFHKTVEGRTKEQWEGELENAEAELSTAEERLSKAQESIEKLDAFREALKDILND